MKRALITGITGQDGSYLSELLLSKGYKLYGIMRRKSKEDYGNVEHIKDKITFVYADMMDLPSLILAVKISDPDEIYNLGAQSFVQSSWSSPSSTSEINAIGTLNLLEAMRAVKPTAKFYQASTSEMFGKVQTIPQNENTPFYPRSPYAVSKLYAHWITINYRESYKLFTCCGILFNHESERRGSEFVTRKITQSIALIKAGKLDHIELGNLDAKRDWGHAKDYVKAMWLILQQKHPDDYVIASGKNRTVREFAIQAFKAAGIDIKFKGKGLKEVGINQKTGKVLVKINPKYIRPAEVDLLLGNPTKAIKKLKWTREISFEEMVDRMVKNDLKLFCKK